MARVGVVGLQVFGVGRFAGLQGVRSAGQSGCGTDRPTRGRRQGEGRAERRSRAGSGFRRRGRPCAGPGSRGAHSAREPSRVFGPVGPRPGCRGPHFAQPSALQGAEGRGPKAGGPWAGGVAGGCGGGFVPFAAGGVVPAPEGRGSCGFPAGRSREGGAWCASCLCSSAVSRRPVSYEGLTACWACRNREVCRGPGGLLGSPVRRVCRSCAGLPDPAGDTGPAQPAGPAGPAGLLARWT